MPDDPLIICGTSDCDFTCPVRREGRICPSLADMRVELRAQTANSFALV